MLKSKITAVAAGAVVVLAASANTGHAAENWVCNVFTGPKHFVNKGLKAWGKDVAKATNGAVKPRFLPANAAPPPKQIDGIAAGTYDCAFIFHAFTAKRAVGPGFGILPFINKGTGTQGSVAFWETWNKHFAGKNEFADDNVHVLAQFQFPGVHFFTAQDKPINSVADLKSQKLWALAGTSSRTMKAMGINHVSGPAARMAEFTQTKVVQGLIGTTRAGIINFAGITFPKHGTFTSRSIMMPSFQWMVNKQKWDALPGNVKQQITSVSGAKIAKRIGKDGDDFEVIAEKRLAKAGMKAHKADPAFEAALQKAASKQVDAWIARAAKIGVDGKAVLADYDKAVAGM